MKARKFKELLSALNEEELDFEIFFADPDKSNIINGINNIKIVTVKCQNEFGSSERTNWNLPIGFKLIKIV